jgi:hypothetical protein
MNNSPRFRVGDRIQCGGAPHLVYQVKEVKVNVYTLAPPNEDLDWVEKSIASIDSGFIKNAREFDRQYKSWLDQQNPTTPGFDRDGYPTFDDEQ